MAYLSKKYVIAATGGALIAAVLIVVIYLKDRTQKSGLVKREEQQRPTEAASSLPVRTEGTGRYTVEAVPLDSSGGALQYPALERPIKFSASYPADARRIMTDKINAAVALLKKDPRQYGEWLNLGILRNGIDDWEGARQIWEFLTTMRPEQPAPFANLANLYAFSLKDLVRAEANLKKAIEKGPKEASAYRLGYEIYRFVLKDDARAREILEQGIKETDSRDLKYLRDHYAEL